MVAATLNDLITCLEYGTSLHIAVLFLGERTGEGLQLPDYRTIHKSPVCDAMKARGRGLLRCVRCRNIALRRVLAEQRAFGGLCINGVYEYVHPVLLDGEVAAVLFVGNILPEDARKLRRRLDGREELLSLMEANFPKERCAVICAVLDGYICKALEAGGARREDRDPLIENIKAYIEENLEYGAQPCDLAPIFHYNEKYLGRLFKARVGVPLSAYVNKRRLERARQMLRGKETVTVIAARVGFNSVTYFNRVFKAAYGLSPTAYRARASERKPVADARNMLI